MNLGPWLTATLIGVVTVAFTVEAALGFGATLLTVSLGALLVPIDHLLPAVVPLNLLLSAALTARTFRDLDRRVLFAEVLPLMAVGLPMGLFLFSALDPAWSQRLLGVLVFVLGLSHLLPAAMVGRALPRPASAGLLILAGVVHGAFATGGPLVVYVLGRRLDKHAFRATLSALWLLLNLVVVGSYVVAGRLDQNTAALAFPLAVGLVLGLVLGERLFARVPEPTFRAWVHGILSLAGLLLVARA